MKLYLILPLLVTSVVPTTVSRLKPREPSTPFSSFSITPLRKKTDTYIEIETNATRTTPVTYTVSIENDVGTNVIVSGVKADKSKAIYTYKNDYTRSENTIILTYKVGKTTKTVSHEALYITSKRETLNDDSVLNSDSSILCYNEIKGWFTKSEKLTFKGFNEFYIPNYYHKLDISDFSIKTDSTLLSPFKLEGTLIINNLHGVFNDLNSNEQYASLKLTKVLINGSYALKFADSLYVNKETLLMSSTPKEGYVPTEHLYFPRNEMQLQDEYDCTIAFTELGIDYDKLNFTFKLKALINTVGDCHNSEYCIVVK